MNALFIVNFCLFSITKATTHAVNAPIRKLPMNMRKKLASAYKRSIPMFLS